MSTVDYLKTRDFGILYYCNARDIAIDLQAIPDLWTDATGKSRVISARICARTFKDEDYKFDQIKINGPIRSKNSVINRDVSQMELVFWIKSATFSQIKKLFRDNKEQVKNMREIYNYYNTNSEKVIKCAILFLDLTDDNSDIKEEELKYYKCLKLKRGGIELIHEYLTSTFIQEYEEFNDIESNLFSPYFTFSSHANLNHLTKHRIEHEIGEYGEAYSYERGSYPYFNLNLDIITRLTEEFIIPPRIRELLTAEQLNRMPDICRDVIMDNIELIFESCFKQPHHFIPQSPTKLHKNYDTWGSDMYDALGGNGSDSVYLSDGMSINPDGSIDED
jgi:hypothetical protein